jgi:hypothetical protein
VYTCRGAWTPLTRSADSTVIPGSVRVRVSIRIVPDQEVGAIATTLQTHLEAAVRGMGSPIRLVVNVDGKADWWLGSLDDPWFKVVEAAVGRGAYAPARAEYATLCSLHDTLAHSRTAHPLDSHPGEGVRVSCAPSLLGQSTVRVRPRLR